jgi:HAD superfamily hydrolase (TIGR01509 family)
VSVETLSARWRAALESAEAALRTGSLYLSPGEIRAARARLAAERDSAARLLRVYARNQGASARFLNLAPAADARRLLALRSDVRACVFNLDGVLIGSAALHATAWAETFDEFLSTRTERTRGRFAPFNRRTDYREHIHGRPRLEGVREFLASRGISLPEGAREDPPGAETVHGLANRKKATLLRRLDEQGMSAFDGARTYLELAREAGMRCAVLSASGNAHTMIQRAGLAQYIDVCVDGNTIAAEHLAPRPAPDMLLEACRQLGVAPESTAVFETSEKGVVAAREAGAAHIVAVTRSGRQRLLQQQGAAAVISGIDEILEQTLGV